MLVELIGEHDADLFRDIFEKNNKATRAEFLNHPFIRSIWKIIEKEMTYEDCFKKG